MVNLIGGFINGTVDEGIRGVSMSMVNVTLPDGTVNEYAAGITAGEVVVDALGKKHGCLAARIDGVERDFSASLDSDCNVEGILASSDEGMNQSRPIVAVCKGGLPIAWQSCSLRVVD